MDYALLSRGRPVLLVEAKALDVQADDYKYVAQVLAYANMTGAEWALLTNGFQWDLYAVLARGDVKNKRIFSTTVEAPDYIDWMGWISPSRVEASELDRFWRLLLAERTVRATVETLFRERSDALVKLLADQTGLHTGEVATALQTLRMSFDGPSMAGRARIVARLTQERGDSALTSAQAPRPAKSRPRKATKPVPTVRTTVLELPSKGKKPSTLVVGDRTWSLETWRDLLIKAVEDLHQRLPDKYDGLFTAPELRGRKRDMFSRSGKGMKTAMPIPGGYAEGNQSAEALVKLVNRVYAWAGVTFPASYSYREE